MVLYREIKRREGDNVLHETIEHEPDVSKAIRYAIGAASVCWETPEKAGAFDSIQALEISEALISRVNSEIDGRFINDAQAFRKEMVGVTYAALVSRCGYPLLYVGDRLLQSPGDEFGIGDLERCCYPVRVLWTSVAEVDEGQ